MTMKKNKKIVDVIKLERQQPERLSRLTGRLETRFSQKNRDVSLWTQEFAATGKDGKVM
jgi:hypothetical protein